MEAPDTARLLREFSVEPFYGPLFQLEDINNDGEPELLFLQSAGQLRAPFYTEARLGIEDADRKLHCLTATRLDGTVLWQRGTPYDRPGIPFTFHGGGTLAVEDVDADGKTEVIVGNGEMVEVLDGATGEVKASTRLPADNFFKISTAQFGPPEKGRQIVLKVNDRAHEPWEYANPTVVYNADLSIYREPFAVPGAGHNVIARDFNGDGRDELLIGYSMLDHELNPIWSIDFGPDFNYAKEHADEIALEDVNNDGRVEIRYAGSEDFVVADLDGNVLWTAHAGHSQSSTQGPWGPDGETRIILNEKNQGLHGMDTAGNVLWTRTDINGYARHNIHWSNGPGQTHWALFQAQRKPTLDFPYESDPAWSRDLWPRFIGGDGTLYDVFPWKEEYAIPRCTIRAKRSYDNGLVYQTLARDINGDGLDEILVFSRQRAWIFGSPEGSGAL